MIDRSDLPFQSARDYQDVNMQKWMGFFLSEHTSALSDDDKQVSYLSDLSLNQKLLSTNEVILKTNDGHIAIALEYIIAITLVEEAYHESA